MITKICTKCKHIKALVAFSPQSGGYLGRLSRCKLCVAASMRRYRDNNRVEHNKKAVAWCAVNKKRVRGYSLKRKYGVSRSRFDSMLMAQDGVCAVCHRLNTFGRELCVDHNHKTGRVRGLLCHRCNTAIGFFGDDSNVIARAISYLAKHDNKGLVILDSMVKM